MSKESKVRRKQAIKVIKFARDNKFLVTPVGMGYYLDGFSEFHACPCDTKRLACPCDQAMGEIQKDGHCLCRLFYRDYQAYLELNYEEKSG